jgi:GT2 family glycosyltransferase/glycosyltransferase involved in cell wall biosynthesis
MLPGVSPYGTLLSHLQRYMFAAPGGADRSLLDLGCGTGYGLMMLGGGRSVGVDISAEAIATANAFCGGGNRCYLQGDIGKVQLGERFDLITNFEVLEHLSDHHPLLDTVLEHLKPEGYFVQSLPNPLYHGSDINEYHIRDLTIDHLLVMLVERFYEVEIFHQDRVKGGGINDLYVVQPGANPSAEFWVAVCRSPKERRVSKRISIVMPVFNKVEFTQKAIESIRRHTSGSDYEIIVVDNGSSDGTVDYLAGEQDILCWRNEENLGFARASNQGALLSYGDTLVFLNNDTEVHGGWLDALLNELHSEPQTGIVGGRLLYPDGTIQHAGVAIGRDQIPFHIHRGLAADHPLVSERRCYPVVTAACAAVRREEFYRLGMFDEGFVNGHEDIDLCLRYRQGGQRVVYRPDCVVTHHESVSDGRMASRPQNLARTMSKWRYHLLQDDFNYAFTEKERGKSGRQLRFALKIGVPNRTHTAWGDIYFAECLAKALCRLGHHCEIHYLCEWGRDDLDIDVVIHLKGLSLYHPKPYNMNLMWMLNHPSLHTTEELSRYDAILVASHAHAEKLAGQLSIPVIPFLQATDPEHFRPVTEVEKRFDLVFVGNNVGEDRLAMRKIVADLLPTSYRLGVWGQGWEGKLPPGVLQGEFVPWEELPQVYNSGRIVLNDHQPEMKENGFVNNRTFDAAACGVAVVSDRVLGLEKVLPVFSYSERDDLRKLVDDLLRGKRDSAAHSAKTGMLVSAQFTFSRRAEELLAIVNDLALPCCRSEEQRVAARNAVTVEPPLVSILMSTYNRRSFLPAAIRSIKGQSYQNWQLVLVNDGGESVATLVARENDPRIIYIELPQHRGKGFAINRAFKESSGRFIAHLDDDDIWYPDHLERLLLPLLTIPGVRMAYTDAYDVWQVQQEGVWSETDRQLRYYEQVTFRDLLLRNFIQGIVVAHDRELFLEAGGMDEQLQIFIDWDLWRRLAARSYPYHVSRVTADHYLRESATTSGQGQITNVAKSDPARFNANQLRVLKKKIDHPDVAPLASKLQMAKNNARTEFLLARAERHEQQGNLKRARRAYELSAQQHGFLNRGRRNFALFELCNHNPRHALELFTANVNQEEVALADVIYAILLNLRFGKRAESAQLLASLQQIVKNNEQTTQLVGFLQEKIGVGHLPLQRRDTNAALH